jgi:membrane-associated phospholipid phosphatase
MTADRIQQYLHTRFGGFTNRFPALTHWLAARLSTDAFNGLPLTLLVGLLIANVMLLSEVAENIVNTEPMVQIDQWFTELLFKARTTRMSSFFFGVTSLGSRNATIGFAMLGSIVLGYKRKWRNVLVLWVSVIGVSLFVQVGKRTFGRARPAQAAYYPETGYSFPSGHSATAMTLYGLLGYFFIRSQKRTRSRVLIGVLASSLILAVGFSRIYLGVHFLSDVLGGYLLGICWLIVGIFLTEARHKIL